MEPQTRSTKTKHSFDDELGEDFLSSWKPSKFMVGAGLDLDDDPPPKNKKKAFSLDKLDIDFDGDLNALSSFAVDMSELDFPSSPRKTHKAKAIKAGSPENCQKEKKKTGDSSVKFRFDFKGFDDLDLDDTLLKANKEVEKPIKEKQKGKEGVHPASSQSLSADECRLPADFAKDLPDSDVSGETLGAPVRTAACNPVRRHYLTVNGIEGESPLSNGLNHVEGNISSPGSNDPSKVNTVNSPETVLAHNTERTISSLAIGHSTAREHVKNGVVSESPDVDANEGTHFFADTGDKTNELELANQTDVPIMPTISQSSEVSNSKKKQPLVGEGVGPIRLQEEQDLAEVTGTFSETFHLNKTNLALDEHANIEQEMRSTSVLGRNDCIINQEVQAKGHPVGTSRKISSMSAARQFSSRPFVTNHDTEVIKKHSMQEESPNNSYMCLNESDSALKTSKEVFLASSPPGRRMNEVKVHLGDNAKEGKLDKESDSFAVSALRDSTNQGRTYLSPKKLTSGNLATLARAELPGEPKEMLGSSEVDSKKSVCRSIDSQSVWTSGQKEWNEAVQISSSKHTPEKKSLCLVSKQTVNQKRNSLPEPASKSSQTENLKLLKLGSRGPNFSSQKAESLSISKDIASVRNQSNQTMQKSILPAPRPLIEKREPQLGSNQVKVENSLSKLKPIQLSVSNALGAKGKYFEGLKSITLTSTMASQKRKPMQGTEKAYATTAVKNISGTSVLSRRKSTELVRENSDHVYDFQMGGEKEMSQHQSSNSPQVLQHDMHYKLTSTEGCDVTLVSANEEEQVLLKTDGSTIENNRNMQTAGEHFAVLSMSENYGTISNNIHMFGHEEVAEKSESYARDVEEMHKMLKRKHEEALDLHVRALVLSNSLLMLKNPMDEDKIQRITKQIEDSFPASDKRQAMVVE